MDIVATLKERQDFFIFNDQENDVLFTFYPGLAGLMTKYHEEDKALFATKVLLDSSFEGITVSIKKEIRRMSLGRA